MFVKHRDSVYSEVYIYGERCLAIYHHISCHHIAANDRVDTCSVDNDIQQRSRVSVNMFLQLIAIVLLQFSSIQNVAPLT